MHADFVDRRDGTGEESGTPPQSGHRGLSLCGQIGSGSMEPV